MNPADDPRLPGRRKFLASAATAATVAAAASVAAVPRIATATPGAATVKDADAIPFWGAHQAGIATPQQAHVYFAAFDLTTTKRDDVIALLRAWTNASARMTQGQPAADLTNDLASEAVDSGEALGLPPNRLTLTFGFGAGMFSKDGVDRYGLSKQRPEALVDLPRFNGDQLVPERTGGDCACRRARMTRRWLSTPCGSFRAWYTHRPSCVGRSRVSCQRTRTRAHRAT